MIITIRIDRDLTPVVNDIFEDGNIATASNESCLGSNIDGAGGERWNLGTQISCQFCHIMKEELTDHMTQYPIKQHTLLYQRIKMFNQFENESIQDSLMLINSIIIDIRSWMRNDNMNVNVDACSFIEVDKTKELIRNNGDSNSHPTNKDDYYNDIDTSIVVIDNLISMIIGENAARFIAQDCSNYCQKYCLIQCKIVYSTCKLILICVFSIYMCMEMISFNLCGDYF